WQSAAQETGGPAGIGVYMQRFDRLGAARGGEVHVNTYTAGPQTYPRVAVNASGAFVIVWDGQGTADATGVWGKRFSNAGAVLGSDFRVNTTTADYQYFPSVAIDNGGNFEVVWSSADEPSSVGVFGQRYSSAGAPLGGEFRVNAVTTGQQTIPDVGSD